MILALLTVVVLLGFYSIHRRISQMFNTVHEFRVAVDAETTAIAAKIDRLIAAVPTLSEADKAELQGISDTLTALGADPANPIPPTT